MAETFSKFNPSEYLTSPEECKVFLSDAFETGDAEFIISAIRIVASSQALATSLPKGGADTNDPSLRQTLTLMAAVGLSLTATGHEQ